MDNRCIIVTVYEPDLEIWNDDRKTRKNNDCVFCKVGETKSAIVTVPLLFDEAAIIVKNVPAEVCNYCGEKYYSADVTEQLDQIAEDAKKRGTELQVTRFAA